jgi:hypothetical protein
MGVTLMEDFYLDVRGEPIPPRVPEPRGNAVQINMFCDAFHASCLSTRRSTTGIIFFINGAPITFYSKMQNTIESSTLGSEFFALKIVIEMNEALRYKLRMMGIPCNRPTYIMGDNQSVLANASVPDSTLKKKNQSIAYFFVREGSARDEWRLAYVKSELNEADLLTKQLPHGEKRKSFVRNLLHHIFRSGHDSY